jgi:hypothetical protein
MILARLRRVRRLSAIAALVCTSVAALAERDVTVVGERRIHQQAVGTGEMMTVPRSAIVEAARPLGSHDRNAVGLFIAPHDRLAVIACDAACRSAARAHRETLGVPRPRRLAFKYEANAPPIAR